MYVFVEVESDNVGDVSSECIFEDRIFFVSWFRQERVRCATRASIWRRVDEKVAGRGRGDVDEKFGVSEVCARRVARIADHTNVTSLIAHDMWLSTIMPMRCRAPFVRGFERKSRTACLVLGFPVQRFHLIDIRPPRSKKRRG